MVMWRRRAKKSLIITAVLVVGSLGVLHSGARASGESFTGSATYSGSRDDAIPINDLQVDGTGNDNITINLFVPSGSLAMGTTTGITFSRDHTGNNLYFSGTRSDVNTALATLTFTPGKTADVMLQATIDGLPNSLYNADTHHVYQYVHLGVNWNEAKTRAEAASFQDIPGYLASLTSLQEASFVSGLGVGAWLGGSDTDSEGVWNWASGPDAGVNFWNGGVDGATPEGAFANWVTGMPDNYTGSNPAGENCLEMYGDGGIVSAFKWNDQNCDSSQAPNYIIEYGGETTPNLTYKNMTIHVTPGRDLDGNGQEDANQPNVKGIMLPNGKWAVVKLNFDCRFLDSGAQQESDLDTQDSEYDYDGGLLSFTGTCQMMPGSSVVVIFYDEQSADMVLRKYNPNNATYTTMSSATLGDDTINGHNVVTAHYSIFDGDDFDTDGISDNNQFTDPIGLGVAAQVSTPDPDPTPGPSSGQTVDTAGVLPSVGSSGSLLIIGAALLLAIIVTLIARYKRHEAGV